MTKKPTVKKLCSIITAFCLVFVQSMNVHAENTACASVEELSILLDGVDSIVAQLKELGLSLDDINELLELSPREPEFYDTVDTEVIPYDGSFAMETSDSDCASNIYSTVDAEITPHSTNAYDGNPPENEQIQRERIEDIYSMALQYYDTDYYEGREYADNAENKEKSFGKYLTYLYLSNYIDGPGRKPTEQDLPYIISSSDVRAYEQFISSARLSNWATSVADLGAALSTDYDYVKYINAIHRVDQTLLGARREIIAKTTEISGYNTANALSTIAPMVKTKIILDHPNTSNEAELTQETFNYVSSELYALNFYENYDENITNAIIGILTSAFISLVLNSVSLIGTCISVIPLYVYNATGIIQTAILVKLQYTFSSRYAIRTGIFIDMEDF